LLLLIFQPNFESAIGCDNEDLLVGIVRSTARGVSYAIVVNKDLHAPQSGRLRGVRESLYDLDSLRKEGDLSIDAIRPGGGRIYLVGGDEQFETEAEAIQSNREQEAARAATPNRLFEQRGCDAQHRDTLDETARIMGSIEPAMYLDNPDATVVERMLSYRVRYWTIHARWVTAYEQLLAGRNAADAGTVLRYSRHLIAEVKTALGDHPMFPGSLRNEDTKDP
jgi:hypothetical protein